jgi:hypothetical protein
MSTPSFQLSNSKGKWWAEGTLESGRHIRFECGDATATRETAEAVASVKWAQRLSVSQASKARWAKAAAAANGGPVRRSLADQQAASKATATPERAAEIRGKLLSLGDVAELDTDGDEADDEAEGDDAGDAGDDDEAKKADYIPPDGKRDDDDEEGDPEDDEEAAELLADVIGNGIYTGVTGGVTKVLKRAKPPREPGEPHELFVKCGREGCCYRMRKLIGKGAKLSPNAKLLIGLAGTIITMVWNSEVIEEEKPGRAAAPAKPAAAPAATSPDAPAAAAPPAHANGVAKPPRLALVRTPSPDAPPEDPLGSFS